ncbi:MAG TPA: Asp23/Gls24 family envelope stress response protein, partial [Ktedonobacterales bacterium]|nr:Asp23/Gls24 family envelope stress response protein [Ktedonobacterales bacterium]
MSDSRNEPTASRQGAAAASAAQTTESTVAWKELVPAQVVEAVQLDSGHGKTVIADTVVAKIAGAAAREIEGVHDLVPLGTGGAIAGFAGRLARADQRSTGVSVEVGQREAAVDLNVRIEYGVSIPQVAEAVRQNITERVRGMTGLVVKEVNINAADLYFPGEVEQSRVQ